MPHKNINLKAMPLAILHQAIIKNKTQKKTAEDLKIDKHVLQRFLTYIIFPDNRKALTCAQWHTFTVEKAQALFGNKYNNPAETKEKISLKELILDEKHLQNGTFAQTILRAQSFTQAASALKVGHGTFKRFVIANFLNNDEELFSWDKLREIAKEMLGKSSFEWENSSVFPADISINSQNNLSPTELRSQVDIILFNTTPELNKSNSDGNNNINQPQIPSAHTFPAQSASLTVELLHRAIKVNTNFNKAAKSLGINVQTLQRLMGPIICEGKPLFYSFNEWKKWSVVEARKAFGTDYDAAIKPNPMNLDDYSLTIIHEVISKSKSLTEAAGRFGVKGETLENFLGRLIYETQPLSFSRFKALSEDKVPTLYNRVFWHTDKMTTILPINTPNLSSSVNTILFGANSHTGIPDDTSSHPFSTAQSAILPINTPNLSSSINTILFGANSHTGIPDDTSSHPFSTAQNASLSINAIQFGDEANFSIVNEEFPSSLQVECSIQPEEDVYSDKNRNKRKNDLSKDDNSPTPKYQKINQGSLYNKNTTFFSPKSIYKGNHDNFSSSELRSNKKPN